MAGKPGGVASRRRRIVAIAIVGVLVAGGGIYWVRAPGPETARAALPQSRAVPVSAVTAARQDVPVYVTGLGTVQASFTIAIHSQVETISRPSVTPSSSATSGFTNE